MFQQRRPIPPGKLANQRKSGVYRTLWKSFCIYSRSGCGEMVRLGRRPRPSGSGAPKRISISPYYSDKPLVLLGFSLRAEKPANATLVAAGKHPRRSGRHGLTNPSPSSADGRSPAWPPRSPRARIEEGAPLSRPEKPARRSYPAGLRADGLGARVGAGSECAQERTSPRIAVDVSAVVYPRVLAGKPRAPRPSWSSPRIGLGGRRSVTERCRPNSRPGRPASRP